MPVQGPIRYVVKKMTVLTELSWNESPVTYLLLLNLPEVQKEEWNSAVGVEKNPNKNKNQNSVLKTSWQARKIFLYLLMNGRIMVHLISSTACKTKLISPFMPF